MKTHKLKFKNEDVVFVRHMCFFNNVAHHSIGIINSPFRDFTYVYKLYSGVILTDNSLKLLGRGDYIDYINIV